MQCNICGSLCGECDRVLHLPKRNKGHQRQVGSCILWSIASARNATVAELAALCRRRQAISAGIIYVSVLGYFRSMAAFPCVHLVQQVSAINLGKVVLVFQTRVASFVCSLLYLIHAMRVIAVHRINSLVVLVGYFITENTSCWMPLPGHLGSVVGFDVLVLP